ncbi:MAG: hypothetical protein RLZZ77_601 [Bacteroidota bacterium]
MKSALEIYASHKHIWRAAVLIFIGACFSLVGWICNIESFKSLIPGATSIKFNTALIFLLISIMMFLMWHDEWRKKYKRWIYGIALFYGLFTLISLSQYLFNANYGIDELFFKDRLAAVNPGRIAVSTSFYILLHCAGVLLWLSDSQRNKRISAVLFNAILIMSTFGLLGYGLRVPVFYSLNKYTSMSLTASILLGISSFVLGAAVKHTELNKLIFGQGLGDKTMRRLMAVLLVTVVGTIYLGSSAMDCGFSSPHYTMVVMAIVFIGVGLTMSFITARQLNAIDEKRRIAEAEYSQVNFDLERKIRIRTQALERSFLQIKRSEESLRSIVNTSPDAFLMINRAGEIKMINDQFTRLTGYSAEEAENLPMKSLWKLQGTVNCVDYLYERIDEQKDITQVFDAALVFTKDGRAFWGELTFNHLRLDNENLVSISLRDITERRKNQEEMYTLTERLKEATQGTGIGIWDYDIQNNHLFWDDNMFLLHRVKPNEFKSTYENWETLVHPDDLKKAKEEVVEVLRSDARQYQSEFRVICPDGQIVYIRAKASVLRNAEGRVVRMIGVNSDITDKKKFEMELIANFERSKIFIEQLPTAVAMFDKDMRYLTASDQWYEDYGLRGQDIIGKSHYEIFPDLKEDWREEHKEVLLGKSLHSDEDFFVRPDGTVHWLTWDVRPWYTNDDEVGGVLMFTANITERKKVENLLKFSEERFRGAFEGAVIGMALVDTEGNWIKVNPSLCDMLGYTLDEMMVISFKQILHESDLQVSLALVNEMYAGLRNEFQMEHRFVHKNGDEIWTVLAVTLVRDENNRPTQMIAQATDITEQKMAERNLAQINTKLQGILDASSQVAIISCDVNGFITTFNKGAENLLEYTAEELQGKYTPEVFHKREEMEERGRQLSEIRGRKVEGFQIFTEFAQMGEFDSREWTYVKKDGTEFPVLLVLSAHRGLDGVPIGYIGVAMDITERKQTEETRRQFTVLEAKSKELEQFAYAASHDLREPLLTIKNYVAILMEEFKENASPVSEKYAQFISKAVMRMEELITGLLDYSRLSRVKQAQVVSVQTILEDVRLDLNSLIERNSVRLGIGEMPTVVAYPLELKLLFQNLISNAIKFTRPNTKPEIDISAQKTENGWLFRVSDNGIGISESDYVKIFDLFQRLHSKVDFDGTGIGLAQCKKIAEIHNGKIWVESKEGVGSDFYFTIQLKAYEN